MEGWRRSADRDAAPGPADGPADDSPGGVRDGAADPDVPDVPQPPPPPGAAPLLTVPRARPPGAQGDAARGQGVAPGGGSGGAAASAPSARSLVYARTLDRAMAYWLDGILVTLPALAVAVALSAWAVAAGLRPGGAELLAGIIAIGIHLLYFVSFWTGSDGATLGMRLMRLRVADARTGAVLTVQQGLVRWLAFGGVFQLLQLVPPLVGVGVVLAVAWAIGLLVTTLASATRQGLHDRIADTAVVQPAGVRTPAMACLVVLVGLAVVWLVALVALVVLGGRASGMLSVIGGPA